MKSLQLAQVSTPQTDSSINRIAIQGYKSIADRCSIDLGYLTVLAGANSSGKSSLLQPLLILKQTLESQFDPGSLLINGGSVKMTSVSQIQPRIPDSRKTSDLIIELGLSSGRFVRLKFSMAQMKRGVKIIESDYLITLEDKEICLKKGLSRQDLLNLIRQQLKNHPLAALLNIYEESADNPLIEKSCFLDLALSGNGFSVPFSLFDQYAKEIRRIIHVPGIRGNPERMYQKTAIGPEFTGIFDKYVASIILAWKTEKKAEFKRLSQDLAELGLTWKIDAKQVDDSQLELLVGRCPAHNPSSNQNPKAGDTVNIADVGFGVSQVLPVLVALLVAEPGQLVYIEQPEIHLHPKAQVTLANLLVRAAKRHVRVVLETHSSILLLAIQALVAEGQLLPIDTRLHWVTRNAEGATEVNSTQLDEIGAFGDWPEDFADTWLTLEDRYLSAVETKLSQEETIK